MKIIQNLIQSLLKVLHLASNPDLLKQFQIHRSKTASFKERLDYETLTRCHYAYGTYYAALQAKALNISKISVIEFGVAGGNGLIELEKIATEVTKEVGVEIAIYGFDAATGMPKPIDYRDCPYMWQPEFFKMDIDLLKSKLKFSELVLGNVANTIGQFIQEKKPAPIGFISFDLDYYSSTLEAFKLLEQSNEFFLPRVFCYFDDCIGDDWIIHSEFAGELLAIKEFNEKQPTRKIAKIEGLRYKRIFEAYWNEVMYCFHLFDHPLYNQYIYPAENLELPWNWQNKWGILKTYWGSGNS